MAFAPNRQVLALGSIILKIVVGATPFNLCIPKPTFARLARTIITKASGTFFTHFKRATTKSTSQEDNKRNHSASYKADDQHPTQYPRKSATRATTTRTTSTGLLRRYEPLERLRLLRLLRLLWTIRRVRLSLSPATATSPCKRGSCNTSSGNGSGGAGYLEFDRVLRVLFVYRIFFSCLTRRFAHA
jgi:hypothetical protein